MVSEGVWDSEKVSQESEEELKHSPIIILGSPSGMVINSSISVCHKSHSIFECKRTTVHQQVRACTAIC